MIEFIQLTMTRFMSYRRTQTIRLADQGLVGIFGPNMYGKSAISEALLWCLFGKTLRGLKHDEVVNRFARKNCKVEVLFRIHKVFWLVRRYRRHHQHSNKVHLYRDGKVLTFHSDLDTQAKLEGVLGCDFNAFVNATVFGGFEAGGRKQFALLTDAEQKSLLDSFLRFERFDGAVERAKIQRVRVEQELQTVAIRQSDLQNSLTPLRDLIEFHRRAEKHRKEGVLAEIGILKERLKRLQVPADVGRELRQAEKSLEQKAASLGGIQSEIQRTERELRKLHSSLKQREGLVGKVCTACGQKIRGKAFRLHVSGEIQSAGHALASLGKKADEARKEAKYGRKILKRLQEQETQRIRQIGKRRELGGKLRELQGSPTPSSPELDQLCIQYSRTLSSTLVLAQQEKRIEQQIQDYRFWEVGFGNRGVKALIFRDVLPLLNQQLRRYCAKIFGDTTEIQFSPTKQTKTGTERELFHIAYRSPSGSSSYVGESSGGRRRVDVCILLVLSWLARASNLLFVDEFLDHLDAPGRERALGILAEQRRSVFVVTHEPSLKSQFEKVWTVTKTDRSSRLETSREV